MSNINIRRDVSDKFYRYKMPRLISKIEGKGNGIKTVIPNMSDIAKALCRPATYPTKFLGVELGAQVKCDEKADRYIVNGAHDAEKLANLLDSFIAKFVLCASCKNPETDLIIKDDNITRDCKACGANLPVDMRHKLCVFIIKNPPPVNQNKNYEKAKKAAAAKTAGSLATPDTASNGSGEEDDGALAFDAEAPAARNDVDEDDDWAQDTSEAAVRARVAALGVGGAVKKLEEAGDDEEEEGEGPYEQFAEFVTAHANNDEEIISKAQELSIADHKVCVVLTQVLFNEKILADKQVEKRAALFRKFVKNEKCQKGILGGVERLVSLEFKSVLFVKTPMILKAFYDADLLDEEVLIKWGEKPSKKYVDRKVSKEIRKVAEPFLNWLKEADEEESEEEEDE